MRSISYPNLTVVGITGSLGKTTTKEVVAGVLSSRRQVFKSEGNLNSEIGLPMTVLNGLHARDRPYEIAVLEMAMYQVGDIRLLARLARPRIGVVTSVLPIHLGRIGTIERIQQAKQELVEELPSDGVAVLNADDPRVAQMAEATSARVVRYGVSENADVRAEHIQSRGLGGVEFDLLNAGQPPRSAAAARNAQRLRGAGSHVGRSGAGFFPARGSRCPGEPFAHAAFAGGGRAQRIAHRRRQLQRQP